MRRSSEATGATRGYVICSEHRSGSTLLCEWLDSTGVLGHPREYFAATERAVAIERDPAGLESVVAQASTANGIYGLKLFSQQFDVTMKARWIERLPELSFIHLERRDLLGQAISLVRAMQTHRYRSHEAEQASATYDGKAIARQLRRLAEASERWRVYFARNGINVLWLVYEDMISDPNCIVQAVASHIGLVERPVVDPGLISVAVQRDAISMAWRARFVEEQRDLRYLDHPMGPARVWARRVARDAGIWLRRLRRPRRL